MKSSIKYPTREEVREKLFYHDGGLYWRGKELSEPFWRLTRKDKDGNQKKVLVTRAKYGPGKRAGTKLRTGFRQIKLGDKLYYEHRLIWVYHYGPPLPGDVIIHMDRDHTNNRIQNLAACMPSEAAMYSTMTSPHSTSLYRGVTKHEAQSPNKPWRATLRHNNVTKNIGWFADEEEAAKAYDRACYRLFGRYAQLNFPVKVNTLFDDDI